MAVIGTAANATAPRARAVLDRLENSPMPRRNCSENHDIRPTGPWVLIDTPGGALLRCRPCFDYIETRPRTRALHCRFCNARTRAWHEVRRDLGALLLVSGLCPACARADEADVLAAYNYLPVPTTPAPAPTTKLAWSSAR